MSLTTQEYISTVDSEKGHLCAGRGHLVVIPGHRLVNCPSLAWAAGRGAGKCSGEHTARVEEMVKIWETPRAALSRPGLYLGSVGEGWDQRARVIAPGLGIVIIGSSWDYGPCQRVLETGPAVGESKGGIL